MSTSWTAQACRQLTLRPGTDASDLKADLQRSASSTWVALNHIAAAIIAFRKVTLKINIG